MKVELAPDVQDKIHLITRVLSEDFAHVDPRRVTAVRSWGTTTDAVARIWSMPKVWQIALLTEPQYVMEVISKRYDALSEREKDETVIHELMHVPKTFSGALVPHKCFGKMRVCDRTVKKMHEKYSLLYNNYGGAIEG